MDHWSFPREVAMVMIRVRRLEKSELETCGDDCEKVLATDSHARIVDT